MQNLVLCQDPVELPAMESHLIAAFDQPEGSDDCFELKNHAVVRAELSVDGHRLGVYEQRGLGGFGPTARVSAP